MRHSFFGLLLCGVLLTGIMATADAQDSNRKKAKRNTSTMRSDTAATRRLDPGNKRPALQKSDSLPVPKVPPSRTINADTIGITR